MEDTVAVLPPEETDIERLKRQSMSKNKTQIKRLRTMMPTKVKR